MNTEIRDRMSRLISGMSRGTYEREEAIALSLLSALAGESIFLLGLPGVGKSMIARRLKCAFKDSNCFEYLMSRFSTPDEIFGPVSISKLKDGDTYERCTDGYLPAADVIFLDEIWKACPAIQNSLLTVLNEKIFHNGKSDIRLPLKGIIAASNELPAEGEGLEALWDRFLIRYIVRPVSGRAAFIKLLGDGAEPFSLPASLALTTEDYNRIRCEASQVAVPEIIMEFLYELRSLYAERFANREDEDEEACPYVSDRRWKKIVSILRTCAYLNGRSSVDFGDCLLLEHILWDSDTQLPYIVKDISDGIVNNIIRHGESEPEKNGDCYRVIAGKEELLISIADYDKLKGGKSAYGHFADGNRIAVNFSAGDFRVRCDKPGTLTVNGFSYPLKNKSSASQVKLDEYAVILILTHRQNSSKHCANDVLRIHRSTAGRSCPCQKDGRFRQIGKDARRRR